MDDLEALIARARQSVRDGAVNHGLLSSLADALEAEMAHADQLAEALIEVLADALRDSADDALAAHRAHRARNETGETDAG